MPSNERKALNGQEHANGRCATGRGSVVSYVDETGKLVYQELKESSGVPELDTGALNAVRTAAPYPAVPLGHSHVTVFRLVRDSAGEAAYAHLGASRTTGCH